MSALPLPYPEVDAWDLPSCHRCGCTVIRADVCLGCGYCFVCDEYADDCCCEYRAEDRYLDDAAREYEDGMVGA